MIHLALSIIAFFFLCFIGLMIILIIFGIIGAVIDSGKPKPPTTPMI